MKQTKLNYRTNGRGLIDITQAVQAWVSQQSIRSGLVNAFVPHTSASLLLNENWDPDVQTDLEAFFTRLCPDGDSLFIHTAEGPDDMSAHIRTALTQNSISIPVVDGKLATGTWQGLYLWEHRTAPHQREVVLSLLG